MKHVIPLVFFGRGTEPRTQSLLNLLMSVGHELISLRKFFTLGKESALSPILLDSAQRQPMNLIQAFIFVPL